MNHTDNDAAMNLTLGTNRSSSNSQSAVLMGNFVGSREQTTCVSSRIRIAPSCPPHLLTRQSPKAFFVQTDSSRVNKVGASLQQSCQRKRRAARGCWFLRIMRALACIFGRKRSSILLAGGRIHFRHRSQDFAGLKLVSASRFIRFHLQ